MRPGDLLAFVVTLSSAVLWVRLNQFSARRGWTSTPLSRKLIHIGTGPLFVLCWLLFSGGALARYLAALVPLAITAQFALIGLGVLRDESAVRAMSRTGNPRELLKGPLFYGIVFTAITLAYWRESPIGIGALMLMSGGDGLADLAGRRWGRRPLPWSPRKTWTGSAAMFAGGWAFVFAMMWIYHLAGVFPEAPESALTAITLVSLGGTLVESLPFENVDNLTITTVALAIGHLLF